jgi:hypothetical protein
LKQAGIRRHLGSLGFAGALALAVALGPVSGSRVGAQPAPPPPPVPNATLTPPSVASPLPSDVPVPTAAPSAAPATAAPSAAPATAEPSAAAATAQPAETPAARGRRHRRGGAAASPGPSSSSAPEPTATPTSPAFATLDGTWEVQLQYINRTEYSYLTLAQTTGGALTGTWRLSGRNPAHYPLTGNYDGRLIRLTAIEPAGPVNFSGYVEGASDMIGLAVFPATASSSPSPGATAAASTPPGALSPVAPTNANDGVAFTAEHRGTPSHNVLKR